jgi:hypothetical protein
VVQLVRKWTKSFSILEELELKSDGKLLNEDGVAVGELVEVT